MKKNYFSIFKSTFLLTVLYSFNTYAQQPGTGDTSFMGGLGPNSTVFSVSVQPDNKIIIGGQFTSVNGQTHNRYARLNANGSLDTSFGNVMGPEDTVLTTAIQADGKILLGGEFWTFNGVDRSHIVRVNADGTFDNTFQMGIGANDVVRAIAVQSDGKILVGGDFDEYNNTPVSKLIRLNSNGTLDTSFNVTVGGVKSITIQDDGKILIGGTFLGVNSTAMRKIARLNSNGTLDPSFTSPINTNTAGAIVSIAVQSTGEILIAHDLSDINFDDNFLARLNSNGTMDTSFNSPANHDIVTCVIIQEDDKIVYGGRFTAANAGNDPDYAQRLARLNANGTYDSTFDSSDGADNIIHSIAFQSNGSIIAGGQFGSYGPVSTSYVTRVHAGNSLGVADFGNNNSLLLYPNPAKENFDISLKNEVINKISVYDINGRVVYNLDNVNSHNTKVNTSKLLKGVYSVQISTDTTLINTKLIIE